MKKNLGPIIDNKVGWFANLFTVKRLFGVSRTQAGYTGTPHVVIQAEENLKKKKTYIHLYYDKCTAQRLLEEDYFLSSYQVLTNLIW